jgi:hypothetical protein
LTMMETMNVDYDRWWWTLTMTNGNKRRWTSITMDNNGRWSWWIVMDVDYDERQWTLIATNDDCDRRRWTLTLIDYDWVWRTTMDGDDNEWWRQRMTDSNERGYRVIRVHELSNNGVQKKKSLESSRWGLQLCFRPHLNARSIRKVMGLQSCGSPNLGNFKTPTWESRD